VAVASAGLYGSLHHIADNHTNIPPLSFFTGRMPFLTPNQQRQSTEGKEYKCTADANPNPSTLNICISVLYPSHLHICILPMTEEEHGYTHFV